MKYKPFKLEHIDDPGGRRTDPRKARRYEEIRQQAIADAERSYDNVRDQLRRLVRSVRGQSASEGGGHGEHAP